jgi:hypothetical protein
MRPSPSGAAALILGWEWSSFRRYATGVEGVVEIESQWTARKREQMGIVPKLKIKSTTPP